MTVAGGSPLESQVAQFRALLDEFTIPKVDTSSVFGGASSHRDLLRGWTTALDRIVRRGLERLDPTLKDWLRDGLQSLATEEATDDIRALGAEVEAALRLSWLGPLIRIPTGKRPTCDFSVNDAFNVEVYCPQAHREERLIVETSIEQEREKSAGRVKVALATGRLTTGSGRALKEDGKIEPDKKSRALDFPTNKLIDRILSGKRDATQFEAGQSNVLWLDLKHGLGCSVHDCVPLRSVLAKDTCFVGMFGVWHAFYGRKRDTIIPDRTALEYHYPIGTYAQQREGWFRDCREATSAIISTADGIIRFDNPWATLPVTPSLSRQLIKLSELRPEYSWFDDDVHTLAMRVDAERQRIAWISQQIP